MKKTFGEEYGSILGSGACERCGSKAKLRGLQRVNTHIIVCHTCCPKCHLVKFTGFTSVNEVAYQAIRGRLQKAFDRSDNPAIKDRIEKTLAKLEANKSLEDLGL